MARRTTKGVVRTASGLARKASPRQRKLSGLRGGKLLPSERWKFELDKEYRDALAVDPEAALFLSVFHEEICTANIFTKGEPHLHTPEQAREIFRSNQALRRDRDVQSYCRGPSLDALSHEGVWFVHRPDEEDQRIADIDRARAVALRQEEE